MDTKTNSKTLYNAYLDNFLEPIKTKSHQKFIAFSWKWKEDFWYSFIIRKLDLEFDLNNPNLFYLNSKIQDNIKTDSVIDLGNLYVFKEEDLKIIQNKILNKDFLNKKLQSKFFNFAKKVITTQKINIFSVFYDSTNSLFQTKILQLANEHNEFWFNNRLKANIKKSIFSKNKVFEESLLLFTKEEKIKQNILQKHKQQAQIIIEQFLKTLDTLDYEIRYKNQANKHWNNKQIKLITKAKQISSLKQK